MYIRTIYMQAHGTCSTNLCVLDGRLPESKVSEKHQTGSYRIYTHIHVYTNTVYTSLTLYTHIPPICIYICICLKSSPSDTLHSVIDRKNMDSLAILHIRESSDTERETFQSQPLVRTSLSPTSPPFHTHT